MVFYRSGTQVVFFYHSNILYTLYFAQDKFVSINGSLKSKGHPQIFNKLVLNLNEIFNFSHLYPILWFVHGLPLFFEHVPINIFFELNISKQKPKVSKKNWWQQKNHLEVCIDLHFFFNITISMSSSCFLLTPISILLCAAWWLLRLSVDSWQVQYFPLGQFSATLTPAFKTLMSLSIDFNFFRTLFISSNFRTLFRSYDFQQLTCCFFFVLLLFCFKSSSYFEYARLHDCINFLSTTIFLTAPWTIR